MNDYLLGQKARGDFNKARFKDRILKFLNVLTPERHELFSYDYVKELLKPTRQRYKGMKVVPISLIIGSEGRYRDFNKAFLPRHEFLRSRWENIDRAILKDIILPPIKLYEIGGVYFVRDGNHRVSVAKMQGIHAIDAEVIYLDTKINLKPKMTKSDLKDAIIQYEKKEFFKKTKLQSIINPDELNFTSTGRYEDILLHIQCHKYYLNLTKKEEIKFEVAAKSWYINLFRPIVDAVIEEKLLSRFPGRTNADLYVWIIRHWDDLKKKYGQNVNIKDAALSYSKRFGKGFLQQTKDLFTNLVKIVFKNFKK